MKTCSKCGELKLLSEFYKDRQKKDGLRSDCKGCAKRYRDKHRDRAAAYRFEHRNQVVIYNKKYGIEHKEKKAAYAKKYRLEHKDKITAYNNEYRTQHSQQIKAKNAVTTAIRSGKLIRPDRCSNPKCNCLCKPDGHHWSYLEEHWLDVEWLCRSCHLKLHIFLMGEITTPELVDRIPKMLRSGK